MQIQVLQQDKPVSLSIISTQKGRQALNTDELTPRERQLLLLLDKDNSELSRQAVSSLLTKIDLNKLAKKGWVEYFVFDSKVPDVLVNAKHEEPLVQQTAKNIKHFLDEYSHHQANNMNVDIVYHREDMRSKRANVLPNTMYPPQDTIPITLPNLQNVASNTDEEYFDDMMIIQTLLNTD